MITQPQSPQLVELFDRLVSLGKLPRTHLAISLLNFPRTEVLASQLVQELDLLIASVKKSGQTNPPTLDEPSSSPTLQSEPNTSPDVPSSSDSVTKSICHHQYAGESHCLHCGIERPHPTVSGGLGVQT